ncbi:MAG: PIN domain-containing protein [Treponema sp.]|uniref:PIN domain-containing protein n=1 Tax=Treponema sp. TaxID=166 RepID=UPI002A91A581|nr:PIN domain-containing protein [Treponema sp.]MDY6397635.1 PIN domain-containing protein [Treponema sp.]
MQKVTNEIFHVFLDTNILENDPFFQKIPNLRLLVDHDKAEILIPDVVICELTKHTIKKSKDSISTVTKNLKILNNIQMANIPNLKMKPFTQQEIETKYNDLQNIRLIKILPSDNIKINRIMQRYISEKKPFAENKDSFRDYALFCTCADYVSNNNLLNCYFISANTQDFANKEKTDFHDDLKPESQGMKYVIGLKEFNALPEVQNIIQQIQAQEEYEKLVENWIQFMIPNAYKRTNEFITTWAIRNIETSNYLVNLFERVLWASLEREIIDKCSNLDPEDFGDFYDAGYVDFDSIDSIKEINVLDFTASENGSVTISGIIKVDVQVSIYAFNWCYDREDDDDRTICVGSGCAQMDFSFDLTLDKYEDFDIDYDLQNLAADIENDFYK